MRRALVLALIAVMMMIGGVAHAAWLATGSGFGASTAGTMPQGSQPIASLSNGDATVSWAQNTSPTVDGYLIARYVSGGSKTTIGSNCDADPVVADTCTEFNAPEGRWQYTVTPKLGQWIGAESERSDELHVPTQAPTDLTAVGSSETSITVTWVDNSDINDAYQVESSPDGENDWSVLSSTESADTERFVDEGLACETARYYRVKALSSSNDDSAYSDVASATTDDCAALEIHVAMMSGERDPANPSGNQAWTAVATITVHDQDGEPVTGAVVNGVWSFSGSQGNPPAGPATCAIPTDSAGTCSSSVSSLHQNIAWAEFEVSGVDKVGHDYVPDENFHNKVTINRTGSPVYVAE